MMSKFFEGMDLFTRVAVIMFFVSCGILAVLAVVCSKPLSSIYRGE